MKRKVGLFLIAVLLAVSMLPLSASAAQVDLLAGKVMYYSSTGSPTLYSEATGNLTDGDPTTVRSIGGDAIVHYDFEKPANITGYQLNSTVTKMQLIFYGDYDGNEIITTIDPPLNSSDEYVEMPVIENVKKVALKNKEITIKSVRELKIYGSYVDGEPEPEPPNPWSGLLDGKVFGILNGDGTKITGIGNITDDDELTRANISQSKTNNLSNSIFYEFSEPADIEGYMFKVQNGAINLKMYDGAGNETFTGSLSPTNVHETRTESVSGVKRIVLEHYGGGNMAYIYEFDVLGTAADPTDPPPDETDPEDPPPVDPEPEDPPPLSSPKGLSATVEDGTVTLTWDAYTGATEYKVYRDGELLTTVTETIYTDSGLNNGQTYKYGVSAVTADGESVQAMLNVKPVKNVIELKDVVLPFSVRGMVENSVGFLSLYGMWIVIVLGVIFSPVLIGLVMKLVDYVGRKMGHRGVQGYIERKYGYNPVKERRDTYDDLTKAGRIKERDEWVAKTGNPYDEKIGRWKWW